MCQHQLAILYRNLCAGLTIHADLAHFAIKVITDVIADDLVVAVHDRIAARLRRGVGTVALHPFLHLVAGVTAAYRARDRGDLLTGAATDLVTQQAAHHSPDAVPAIRC